MKKDASKLKSSQFLIKIQKMLLFFNQVVMFLSKYGKYW